MSVGLFKLPRQQQGFGRISRQRPLVGIPAFRSMALRSLFAALLRHAFLPPRAQSLAGERRHTGNRAGASAIVRDHTP